MALSLLVGAAGGLISALLFYSASRGSVGLSLVLFFLTPLPSLIAGLGWGLPAAVTAAVVGALGMAIGISPAFALGYALALGIPVAMLTHLAYLARPRPEPQTPDWYPSGRLMAGLAFYGGMLPLMVLPLVGGTYAVLEPAMIEFTRRFFVTAGSRMGLPVVDEAQLKSIAHMMIDFMPAAFASYWTLIFAGNLYLAGRVTLASGHLGRTWPDLHNLTLPSGMLGLLLAAILGVVLATGAPRIIAVSLLGGLLVAYAASGLSVIHTIAHGARKPLLWPLYITLPFVGMYTLAALLLVGIGEPVLKLRERLGPTPPAPGPT
jgi:hypothetical protein